jgi:uncharacterized protein (TIGR02246 family)
MPAGTPDETNALFEAAINNGDVDAALALYEPEACLVATPGEPVFGHDAIRAALQRFVDAKPTLKMEASSVLQVGEVALTAHAWKATGVGPDGPVELGGHAVEVVRRQVDGTWQFVIDDPYGGETPPAD